MLTTLMKLFGIVLTRCYGDFGCYSLGGPFQSPGRLINVFPLSPDIINASFHLYNRYNNFGTEKIYDNHNFSELQQSSFCSKCDTKIIIHGFSESTLKPWLKTMAQELLKHDNYNVIIVDWRNGAQAPYTQAVANARIMGVIVARFINKLKSDYGVTFKSIHIIGHSLGAQVASYVGQHIKGLGRITGLDPAKPYFENTPKDVRLDSSDADFVDVIHTDTGGSYSSFDGAGFYEAVGHVDFYPNGGVTQPGCEDDLITFSRRTSGSLFYKLKQYFLCNHKLSYLYFIESINTQCPFLAAPCQSWKKYSKGECFDCTAEKNCYRMGLATNSTHYHMHNKHATQPLKLYLITGQPQPHCRHHYKISVEVGKGHFGKLFLILSGERADSQKILFLNREMKFYNNTTYVFVVGDRPLGNVNGVILQWKPSLSLAHPITWLLRQGSLTVQNIKVDHLESGKTSYFQLQNTNLQSGYEYFIHETKSRRQS